MKTCLKCGVAKRRGEFHRDAARSDGLHRNCKPCVLAAAKRSQRRYRTAGGRKVVYVLRGPDGVYVGATLRPKARLMQHRNVRDAACPAINASIRTHGFGRFTFEVVATAVRSRAPVEWLEQYVIRQLAADGERILNRAVFPRAAKNLDMVGR